MVKFWLSKDLYDLFYHQTGRMTIPEPGIAQCTNSGCERLYTPTPLSKGECEKCRRAKETGTGNSVSTSAIQDTHSVVAKFRKAKVSGQG